MGSNQLKVIMSWLAMTLGVWDTSVISGLSQDELLNTKPTSWVDVLQQSRRASQKRTYRSQKGMLVHLRTFPEL